MSIIRKVRNTEEYRKKLESLPQSTRNNKIDAVNKFQKYCEKNHNSTSDEICKELLILKKQHEEEYTDTLYDILQEWITEYSNKLNPNSVNTIFSNVKINLQFFSINRKFIAFNISDSDTSPRTYQKIVC